MKKYYDYPTQVTFIEESEVETYGQSYSMCSGIAYHDFIICGCCGATIPLNEVLWLKEYKCWIDIMESIVGGKDLTDEEKIESQSAVDRFIDEYGKEE